MSAKINHTATRQSILEMRELRESIETMENTVKELKNPAFTMRMYMEESGLTFSGYLSETTIGTFRNLATRDTERALEKAIHQLDELMSGGITYE